MIRPPCFKLLIIKFAEIFFGENYLSPQALFDQTARNFIVLRALWPTRVRVAHKGRIQIDFSRLQGISIGVTLAVLLEFTSFNDVSLHRIKNTSELSSFPIGQTFSRA